MSYDPLNAPHTYFSIGEVIAALSITLIIPQFFKPIYRFRLASQSIQLLHIYVLLFIGSAFVLVSAILPNIGASQGSFFTNPFLFELLGGVLFLFAIGALTVPILWPARVRRGTHTRFAKAAAHFLAHANQQDQADFSSDLRRNIKPLIDTAESIPATRNVTAFFLFRYRRQIEEASYAWSLLQLVAEPQFCETLVHRCPWDTAAILRIIADENLRSQAAMDFVQEIGRQAVLSETSMIAREIGYTGFRAAPVLSESLFRNRTIVTQYEPLAGIRYDDISHVNRRTLERLTSALHDILDIFLEDQYYPETLRFSRTVVLIEWTAADVHRQIRADRSKFPILSSFGSTIRGLVKRINKYLKDLDGEKFQRLYLQGEETDSTILDAVAESVFQVLCSFANDFRGYDDPYWMIALDIENEIFGRFGEKRDGLNPFQQRVAIKLIKKVQDNMAGLYPAITRVLLPVIGPYRDDRLESPKSAFSLLRESFYFEMKRFPELYNRNPEKVRDYLPENVRYDAEAASIVHIYRGGQERCTELGTLSIEPVNFEADVVRQDSGRAQAGSD